MQDDPCVSPRRKTGKGSGNEGLNGEASEERNDERAFSIFGKKKKTN